MFAFFILRCVVAQYPSYLENGHVEMPGVPISLVVDPPLSNGLYRAFGMAQTTANEYNCNCMLKQPEWSVQVAEQGVVKRYESIHGKVDAKCSVMAFGYRWQGAFNFGLLFSKNDVTASIPALLSATSTEGAENKDAALFELGYYESRALHSTCNHIVNLNDLCQQAYTTELCVSANKLEGHTVTFQQCCWIQADMHRTQTAIVGATIKQKMTTPCYAQGLCVSRLKPLIPNTVYAFGHGAPTWLPSFPSLSTADAQFCVLNMDVLTARFTFIATGDAVELYGSAGTYPGTCLKPQMFREGQVHPPKMLDASNGSVHYCDFSYPDLPVPFELKVDGGSPVFCHNDALTPAERRDVCRNGGAEVLVAKQLNYRTKINDACNLEDKVCILIPGDTFDSMAKIIDAGVDITGFTFYYLNVPINVLQLLMVDAVVMDLRYDTNVTLSPMRSNLTYPEESVLLGGAVQPSELIGAALCSDSPMTQTVFDELEVLLESRKQGSEYVFMASTVAPTATTKLTSVYAEFYETTTVEFENVKVMSAFKDRPAVINPVDCYVYYVLFAGFEASNVIFNQTKCDLRYAYDRVPIVLAGEIVENTVVSNVTVKNAEAPVLFLAGPTPKTRWVSSKQINVSGSLIEAIRYEYDDTYTGQMFFTALMGGVAGSAVVKGVEQAVRLNVNTSLTPQLSCSPTHCVKPNNTALIKGITLLDISTCGQGCRTPISTLNDGLTCGSKNEGHPVQDCRDIPPEQLLDSDFVDSLGLGCMLVFPTVPGGCADRELVPSCGNVIGSVRCVRFYDRQLRACAASGGETCTALGSCGAVSAQAQVTPDSGGLFLSDLRPNVTKNGAPFTQQWFFQHDEVGKSILCASRNPYNNVGCVGGCADSNVRCSSNVCPRIYKDRFQCLQTPAHDTHSVSGFSTYLDTRVGAPDYAAEFVLRLKNDVELIQINVDSLCLTRDLSAQKIIWTACQASVSEMLWLVTRVKPGVYQVSIPEDPFDCITTKASPLFESTSTLFVSPCFPCNVGPGNARAVFGKAMPSLFDSTAVLPSGTVGVAVTKTQILIVNESEPSQCVKSITPQNTVDTVETCGSVTTWTPDFALEDPTGVGLFLTGKAAQKNGLVAIRCKNECNLKKTAVNSSSGTGAVVDCFGTLCFALLKGNGYEYGESVYAADTTELGTAIVETVLVQGTENFTLAAIGVETIDLAELLSAFGKPFEHQIFHRPPANDALIWGGVISLWIAGLIGVLTCIVSYSL